MKKFLFVILTIFLITGNNDYQELNDLSIVTAINIDYINDNYNISLQIQNPNKDNNEFIIYDTKAKTLDQAFNNILNKSPNKLYYKHLEVLYVTQNIANNNLNKVIDYFNKNSNTRNEFNILINKNNNKDIIKIPATNIKKLIKTNTNNIGISQELTFNDLLNNYLNPYKELTLPSIEINSNNEIKLSTIAIFKNNKFLYYLTEEENIGFNIIKNNIKYTTLKCNCKNNNYFVTKIHSLNSKVIPNIKNNTITINIKAKYDINENNCSIKINNNIINDNLKSIIVNTINTLNTYNTDSLNIQDLYYKKNTNYIKLNNKTWYEQYKNIKFNINIDITKDEKQESLGGIYE